MILKKVFFLLLLTIVGQRVSAQDDFCEAVNAIMQDAPNKFRNVKGNALNPVAGGNIWDCGIKVPGTIKSRFVASMGLFYEGALFQTKNKEEVKAAYARYGAQLSSCLVQQGFAIHEQENFTPELKSYKKLVFMAPEKNATADGPPAHATMEAMYNKQVGLYTIVMYIFEH